MDVVSLNARFLCYPNRESSGHCCGDKVSNLNEVGVIIAIDT